MKKIIVVFKTHLDIGFTDFSKNVIENYMTNYLPNAMRVAREMRGEKEGFIWTTGSWLIEKFLEESGDGALLAEAIKNGEIRWHGLPFTTHTELMSKELFQYGLGISQKLNRRFGMRTIAAKMTDVPGHTRAMIPYLVQAGIRFLHIGVNPASKRPDVPTLFWWKAVTGESLLVMYHNDYGELTPIGDGGTAVCFAHTGDNSGPQSAEEIRQVYCQLHSDYPEAELCAGTLEDVAKEALKQENLPVIDQEIGDTWIHGVGTDPKKVSQFRGLLRLKDVLDKEDNQKMYKELLLVPEHTWGLDEKTWLGETKETGNLKGEHTIFKKEEFLQARNTEKFRRMEASWQEQREYVEHAAKAVPREVYAITEKVMSEYRREPWDTAGYEPLYVAGLQDDGDEYSRGSSGGEIVRCSIAGYDVAVDNQGALCRLRKEGRILADGEHRLGAFSYEIFSEKEYDEFLKAYVVSSEVWAIEDFSKIGMGKAVSCYREYLPQVQTIYGKDHTLVITMRLPKEAVVLYGGMRHLELVIQFQDEHVDFDFAWWGKEPTRVAEASWLEFCPREQLCQIQKMGTWINPDEVVKYGNRRMHAVDEGVRFETLRLQTLDTPLISVGERALLKFPDTLPKLDRGIYCNLHNNIWGTNFPMWYEDDARFRFTLGKK